MGRALTSCLFRLLALGTLAFAIASCATATPTLSVGMTTDQAVAAMGRPDLTDTVPDRAGSGSTVTRYAWLNPGKLAIFGADNRVAEIEDLPVSHAGTAALAPALPAQQAQAGAEPEQAPAAFDPIQTPLNYLFYPLKLGLAWVGAGFNCVAEGECRRPRMAAPDAG